MSDLQSRNQALVDALDDSKRLQADLIQSEKLAGIGTLAAGIAHEISSPLFGIMGLAEAITDEENSEDARYAKEIVKYCRSIREIMQYRPAIFARDVGRQTNRFAELRQSVEDAIRLIRRGQEFANVQIDNEMPDGLVISARPNEIWQVFVNLIRNGIQAAAERVGDISEIRVLAPGGAEEAGIWVEVEDNEPGIPVDKMTQLYDPFFTTKAPGSGTGLGLNIVYRIMTRCRGSIRSAERGGIWRCVSSVRSIYPGLT